MQMLYNAIKWDEGYWALGATGRDAARYQLGTGQPTWQNSRKAKFWQNPLRVDTRRSLREALCAEETKAGSGGAAFELHGVCSVAFAGTERAIHFTGDVGKLCMPRSSSCILKSRKEVRHHFCRRDSERSLPLKGSLQSCTVQI